MISRLTYHLRRVLANTLAASFPLPKRARRALLRALGVPVGVDTELFSGLLMRSLNVTIGDRVFVNYRCQFVGDGAVTLEDDVFLGPGVTIVTDTHPLSEGGTRSRAAGGLVVEPVVVGLGSWIGANVTILPGCHIAPGCMVAAGAVVTKPTERDGLYAGVPAERRRDFAPLADGGRISAAITTPR